MCNKKRYLSICDWNRLKIFIVSRVSLFVKPFSLFTYQVKNLEIILTHCNFSIQVSTRWFIYGQRDARSCCGQWSMVLSETYSSRRLVQDIERIIHFFLTRICSYHAIQTRAAEMSKNLMGTVYIYTRVLPVYERPF